MKSEVAIDTLETFSRIQGGDLRDAMELGVKALRNQAKYEEALRMACQTLMDNTTNEHKHNRRIIAYLAGKLAEIASVTADKPVTTADIIELAERNVHK